jgi:hypothetical protein
MECRRTTADLADLLMTLGCRASDPRDKVFALLGLIQDSDLCADYTLSVQEVYIGIGAFLLTEHRATHLLQYAGRGLHNRDPMFQTVSKELPTWVPNWLLGWSSSDCALKTLREEFYQQYPNQRWIFPRPGHNTPMLSTTREQRVSIHKNTGALSLSVHVLAKCWNSSEVDKHQYRWAADTGQDLLVLFQSSYSTVDMIAWVDGCDVFLHLRGSWLLGNCIVALSDPTLTADEDVQA